MNLAFKSSASSLATFSLIVFGAPSTKSLASFNPKPVASLTTFITFIFWSPASFNITLNEDFSSAVDYLSTNDLVDSEKIGILGICGWGGMALNAAALDTRVKATVTSTMYDMSRVNANGYFDEGDKEEVRYENKKNLNHQRTLDYQNKTYARAGGCLPLPVPDDVPFYVKDYSNYYKGRGYHQRSLNSNEGWNVTGCMSFINQPLLKYSDEIRSAVLMIHGEKAHSLYFSKDAYANMIKNNKYIDNKKLMIIPDAVHTDLYDNMDKIPFTEIENFYNKYLEM